MLKSPQLHFAAVILIGLLLDFGFIQNSSAQTAGKPSSKVHALLVGVTAYPNLSTKNRPCDLIGPGNDVIMMAETLKQFDAQVVTLSEASGGNHLPTFANVKREFERIASEVGNGDQVLILLAGHGERSLNDNPETDPETDGMDEVFLTRDASFVSGVYTNAVTDDQINEWLTKIRHAGATVMFVSDSCHSDTQTRGVEVDANGPLERGLDLSKEYEPNRPWVRPEQENENTLIDLSKESGSLLAFFAARNKEKTPDRFRVPGAEKAERQGLLTYTICEILNQHPGLTYRELGQRIKQKYDYYRNVGIFAMVPHPTSSGTDLDRVVLGNRWATGRSRLVFEVKGDIYVSGGTIDGLTKGSILKLLPQVGEGQDTLGWAIVDRTNSRDSVASLIDYDPVEKSWSKRIPTPTSLARGRCIVESIQFAGQKLAIDLDESFRDYLGADLKAKYQNLVAKIRAESNRQTSPYSLVESDQAEFLLRLRPTYDPVNSTLAELELRTRGKPGATMPSAAFRLGPLDDKVFERITNRLLRISRAKRLVGLASQYAGRSTNSSNAIRFTVDVEVADQEPGPYTEWVAQGGKIPIGKFVRFRIRNHSQRIIQVTLLYVSDDYGIEPLLPNEGDIVNEIPPMKDGKPGEKIVAQGSQLPRISRRPESILAIVTGKEPLTANSDYTYLQQPALPASWMPDSQVAEARGRGGWASQSNTRGKNSPLEYLAEIGFNPSQRGGLSPAKVPDHALAVVNFMTVEPKPKRAKFDIKKSTQRLAKGPWHPEVADNNQRGFGEAVFPKVAPSVVVVRTDEGHGTGFVVDDGWIVTNEHVANGATQDPQTGLLTANIHVGALNSDGFMTLNEQPLKADVYKWDTSKDLALLKIRDNFEAAKLKPLKLASKPITPGADCVSIGHPAAGALWLLRSGEIQGASVWPKDSMNNLLRRLEATESERDDLERALRSIVPRRIVISSCGCNPGDSGGPLVNKGGEVIAVTFATPLIDLEKKISLDEFSYHIDLSELRRFLADKPDKPLLLPPDPWGDANIYELTTLSDRESADTLVGGNKNGPNDIVFAIDLDHDMSPSAYRNKQADELKENWDHEFIGVFSNSRNFIASYYDTDNDRKFDLVHQLVKGSEKVAVWKRGKDGRWSHQLKTDPFEFFDYAPLAPKFGNSGKRVFEQARLTLKEAVTSIDSKNK